MKKMKGITLIELIVVLAITGIIAVSAIPSFYSLIEKSRGESAINKVSNAVTLTRITAIKSSSIATLCPSNDNYTCNKDWSSGMIVFVDHNGDRKINAKDELIRVFSHFPEGSSIIWKAFQNKPYLQYSSTGFTKNQNGTFTYCPKSKELTQAKMLIINRAGRQRIAKDNNGDGVVEGGSKKPPICV